ncbi:MAG: choline-sulfatase [Verrucomicrobiales bacterium]|jgi:choline-sulfatase
MNFVFQRSPHALCALLAILVSIAAASTASTAFAGIERPNILFVLTDDQAPWAIGVDNPQAQTPHMDRLFRQGVQLTQMFVTTPVCSPSRASLMTSRYGSELGITDWINNRVEPGLGLSNQLPAWPKLLAEAGYHTGLVGKWHLGMEDHFHPTQFGFQYFMGHRSGGWSTKNPTLEKESESQKFDGLTVDVLADHAIGFLEEAPKDKPFLLCWHTRAPHTAWLPVAEEDWEPFDKLDPVIPNPDYPGLDTKRVKKMTREYLASVRGVDRNLGRVLEKLDALGISDNTVVVFTSDHGYSMGHNGIWHKGNGHWVLKSPPAATTHIPKGQRPNLFDLSIRVPSAVRWPGHIASGQKIHRTLRNIDWFPTLLDAAGVDLPEDASLRGRSFLPLLLGNEIVDWNDDLYCEYSTHHQSRTHMRMYRTKEWKLIRDFLSPERDELYHLASDPAERHNLIKSADPVPAAMKQVLDYRLSVVMDQAGTHPPATPNGPGGAAIHKDYRKQVIAALGRAGDNAAELRKLLQSTASNPDESEAASFLIAFMPEDDLQALTSDYLLENIQLALKVRAETPWAAEIPKDIFLNDVLPYASANETRENWRQMFYETFLPMVKDFESAAEAAHALNQNMFRVLNVKYSTARRRADQAPFESIEQGLASCSGLSIMLTDACRAVGIPARLAGTPLWTNKRGNHTWVEVWDQKWHFTGACEADPNGLNRGWFVGSAAKADETQWLHRIYATSFRGGATTFPFPWLIGRKGFRSDQQPETKVNAVDVTSRYTGKSEEKANVANLMIQVFQSKGGVRVAADAQVIAVADGKEILKGTTRDHRHDTNDMLEVEVPMGTTYTIKISWKDGNGTAQKKMVTIKATQQEQLIEILLAE